MFVGCTPFWGVQTVLAIALAFALGANRPAAVLGVWLNLPWVAPVLYAGAWLVGAFLLDEPPGAGRQALAAAVGSLGGLGWAERVSIVRALAGPLLLGTTLLGLGAAALAYALVRRWVTRRRACAVS